MSKSRKVFSILFSLILCIFIAATILFSGGIKTMEPDTINLIVKSDTESTIKLAEKYVDINQKLEDIFSSSTQMEKLIEVIEKKGKTIQDITDMLGKSVFSDIVSKYARGMTDYLANSSTDIYITQEEVKEAMDNSRASFEEMLGEEISDTNWNSLSKSFDEFATDIVAGLPEYSKIKTEVFGDTSGVQEKVLGSVFSGKIAWIFLAASIIDALIIIIIVRGRYKFIINIGISMIVGAALSYISCLILQLKTDSFLSESILEIFVLRAVSLINLLSLAVAIVGLILTVIYILINNSQNKRKKITVS